MKKTLAELSQKYGSTMVDEEEFKKALNIKEEKVWKPKKEEYYYYYTESGIGLSNQDIEENRKCNFGNFFKTKEEAEFARDKRIFLTRFERYLRENEDEPVDWGSDRQKKYCIVFDTQRELLGHNYWTNTLYQGTIFTTSKKVLEQFIKDNEADIKKYLFGVV